jgi:hypothetical protein
MNESFNFYEFSRFRSAHLRANGFIGGVSLTLMCLIGLVRWGLGFDTDLFSEEYFYIFVIVFGLCTLIPRAGYKLSRHICGSWYDTSYGETYAEYKKNEKLFQAKQLLEE